MNKRSWIKRLKDPWIGDLETAITVRLGLVRGLLEWRQLKMAM